jgi:hypothetical protein
MKMLKKICAVIFVVIVSNLVMGAGCATISVPGYKIYDGTNWWPSIPGNPPPAPTGYKSWAQWGSLNNITTNYDFSQTPPPNGYTDWNAWNSDPSVPAPSGYDCWQDWLNEQLGYDTGDPSP